MIGLAAFLLAHAATRFGGLWVPALTPLSMMLVWPMPWAGPLKARRTEAGFRRCRLPWMFWGTVFGVAAAGLCAIVAAVVHGSGDLNWFHRHATALGVAASGIPEGLSASAVFWFLTIPALLFSPTAEEILFRGYLLRSLSIRYSARRAVHIQAAAFALMHLAHYGLRPWQPGLIPVWLCSMYLVGWGLGVLRQRSGSIWPAMVAHAGFNLGMNAVTAWWFPMAIGIH